MFCTEQFREQFDCPNNLKKALPMAKSKTVPPDPKWRPNLQKLKQFKDRFWRADKNQPWEDVNASKITGTPIPIVIGGCGGYAIFQLQSDGSWNLVENHCVAPCTPIEPLPSQDEMPVGMQVSVPC